VEGKISQYKTLDIDGIVVDLDADKVYFGAKFPQVKKRNLFGFRFCSQIACRYCLFLIE
jgi:hypothetical protein